MKYLTFTKSNNNYEVYFRDLLIGNLVLEIDGSFYFNPLIKGYWSDYFLREISDKLFELNAN